ncbi:MAG: hypothetical protein HQK79_10870 [Desulfobacterales bacterium]|nr:hypothetical protein [Desulfobacterales bacterium]
MGNNLDIIRKNNFIKMNFVHYGKFVSIFLILFIIFNGSFYKVDQTELANVRRFGVVRYNKPVKPGLHFKIPIIDTVDKLQVTLTTLHVPPFDVTTIDNQKITLDMNFNYTIPEDKVFHIMYEIGRAGSVDIEIQIIPVVRDRTSRIFAIQNMATVNANRSSIQNEIEKSVAKSVEELFGIQPHSLQIAGITPSAAFMASNEAAVKAKNEAVAAENTKRTRQFEADQVVIKAKGEADSAIEAARGRSQSALLEAQANKTKLELEGEGEASKILARATAEAKGIDLMQKALAQSPIVVEFEKAKRWNGQLPVNMFAGAPIPFLDVNKYVAPEANQK